MIATDGVFSMDGYLANLSAICDLAKRHGALVMVDDSHAVGFMGRTGRGTHEFNGVMGRVDILTGTLGKALGGASGGYTIQTNEVAIGITMPFFGVEICRQHLAPAHFHRAVINAEAYGRPPPRSGSSTARRTPRPNCGRARRH